MRISLWGATFVAVFAAACTGSPAEPVRRDLVVGTTAPLDTVRPWECFDLGCATLLPNVFEGLTRPATDIDAAEPALASSWEVSADGRTYTFSLRPDVRFHGGRRLRASDARSSLERLRSDGGPAAAVLEGVETIDAPDDRTVTIALREPDTTLPARLGFVAAAIAVESGGAFIGTGPYRLGRVGRAEMELVRNDDHWASHRGVARAVVRRQRNAQALLAALGEGTVDLAVRDFTGDERDRLRAEDVTVDDQPGASTRFLVFNSARAPFGDLPVRRAIAAAVDRESLVATVLEGVGSPLESLVPDGLAGSRDVFSTERDRDAVDRYLGEAGFGDTEKVSIDLWYTPTHYGEAEAEVARAIERSLEATGRFDVTVRDAEWTAYKASFSSGDYGMFLLGWYPDVLHPLGYLDPFLRSSSAAAAGSSFSDEDADRLLDEAFAATDPERVEELVIELQELAADRLPYLPLWQPGRTVARTGRVGPVGAGVLPAVDLARVELETGS